MRLSAQAAHMLIKLNVLPDGVVGCWAAAGCRRAVVWRCVRRCVHWQPINPTVPCCNYLLQVVDWVPTDLFSGLG
jgi:hypothetical protein